VVVFLALLPCLVKLVFSGRIISPVPVIFDQEGLMVCTHLMLFSVSFMYYPFDVLLIFGFVASIICSPASYLIFIREGFQDP